MTPSQPEKILIIKPSALGDIVTALPLLRSLRRKFPKAHIAWLVSTSCSGILEGDADLDEIIPFERKKLGRWYKSPAGVKMLWDFYANLRKNKFDWVIDLQGLIRSGLFSWWTGAKLRAGFADAREGAFLFYNHKIDPDALHTVDRNVELARSIGLDAKGEDMTLTPKPEAIESLNEKLKSISLDKKQGYVVTVPPTRWETKKYPPRLWRKVAAVLGEKLPVLVIGSPAQDERDMCGKVADGLHNVYDLSGRTNLQELVALIAASRGVICSDSAAKFIAPAVGVSCITLIGPTQTQRTGPYLKGQAIVANLPCQGCLKKRCSHITCMQSINPELVIEKSLDMIGDICQ